jgi:hypothetical protein
LVRDGDWPGDDLLYQFADEVGRNAGPVVASRRFYSLLTRDSSFFSAIPIMFLLKLVLPNSS